MLQSRLIQCLVLLSLLCLMACSTTSNLDEGEQLYIGMKKIEYTGFDRSAHSYYTQAEVEGALACAPNGAFFGSSYYRTPLPYGLWVWNACADSKKGFAKWLNQTLGKAPVLMNDVNPELRTTVAETVLANNGYFRGNVTYNVIESGMGTTKTDTIERPLKAKIAYHVNMGPLFTLDSISYVGFSADEMNLILSGNSILKRGDPFSIANLDAERKRIYEVLRENGYYFYQQDYATYLADTLQVPGKVQLQLHKIDSLPEVASHKWVIGRTTYKVRREAVEQLTDTVSRRFLTVEYGGKRPPLRPRVVLQDVRLRPGDVFTQSELEESTMRLTSKGIFSAVDINFAPRYLKDGSIMTVSDTVRTLSRNGKNRAGAGVLDMTIDCILDKPISLSMEGNFVEKTSGRGGPGVGFTFGRRNAFRGGENLYFNLAASADFPIGNTTGDTSASYDIKGDVTLELPRMLLPKFIKPNRRWYSMPTTLLRLSMQTINKSGFYRRNILSAELAYNFRPKETVRHTFSPLIVDYSYIASRTEKFDSILNNSLYSLVMVNDNFIPRMRYTYNYLSPSSYRNPINFSFTFTEAGTIANSILSLGQNHSWDEKNKKMFGVELSQFLKFEANLTKRWAIGNHSSLHSRTYLGYLYSFGNSDSGPMSELFYMGGANDLRGFATRSVGPGRLYLDDRELQYVLSLGDLKFLTSLEYRPRLFGSLYGAIFIDAGNTWDTYGFSKSEEEYYVTHSTRPSELAWDIALDAGIGIRYDLDFFVLRVDWGFIVHAPYDTGRSGYFNTPGFKRAQCLNFAIGYPF